MKKGNVIRKTIDLTEVVIKAVKNPEILLINCSDGSNTEIKQGFITAFFSEDIIAKVKGKAVGEISGKRQFTIRPKFPTKIPIGEVSEDISRIGLVYKMKIGREVDYLGTSMVIDIAHTGEIDFINIT